MDPLVRIFILTFSSISKIPLFSTTNNYHSRVYEITINENCKKTFEKVIVDCNLLIFESDSTIRYDMEERACGHFFLSRLFYFYGDPRMLKGMHYTRMTQFRDTVFLAGWMVSDVTIRQLGRHRISVYHQRNHQSRERSKFN